MFLLFCIHLSRCMKRSRKSFRCSATYISFIIHGTSAQVWFDTSIPKSKPCVVFDMCSIIMDVNTPCFQIFLWSCVAPQISSSVLFCPTIPFVSTPSPRSARLFTSYKWLTNFFTEFVGNLPHFFSLDSSLMLHISSVFIPPLVGISIYY